VLIVEDHDDVREVFAWCMRAAGWQVDTVTTGLEAVILATATNPDVIVMDINLPVLDGIAATRRLKIDERTAHVPVIACTAFPVDRQELLDAGFDGIVPKPCSPDELCEILEQVAGRRSG
jgi:two-component system cell cycle response regulator DivK